MTGYSTCSECGEKAPRRVLHNPPCPPFFKDEKDTEHWHFRWEAECECPNGHIWTEPTQSPCPARECWFGKNDINSLLSFYMSRPVSLGQFVGKPNPLSPRSSYRLLESQKDLQQSSLFFLDKVRTYQIMNPIAYKFIAEQTKKCPVGKCRDLLVSIYSGKSNCEVYVDDRLAFKFDILTIFNPPFPICYTPKANIRVVHTNTQKVIRADYEIVYLSNSSKLTKEPLEMTINDETFHFNTQLDDGVGD